MRAASFSVFALAAVFAAQSAAAQDGVTYSQDKTYDCTLSNPHGRTYSFLLKLDEQHGIVEEVYNGSTTKFRATFAPKSVVYRRYSASAQIDRVNGHIRIVDNGAANLVSGTCSVAPPAAQPLLSRLTPLSDIAAANARRS